MIPIYVMKTALSNPYRMWLFPKGRNYFQVFFTGAFAHFCEFFLGISVTYRTHPNPIPRDRHAHLASARGTRKHERIAARW